MPGLAEFNYRRKNFWISLLVLLTGVIIALLQPQTVRQAGKSLETHQPGLYSVARFADGDTIAVDMNGRVEKVRFIGVDTPETHKPNAPVECYGPAAAAFTKNVIGRSKVRLASDSQSTNRDRYDRLLRYVYLPDGTLLNERLIREGYGFYYPYFPFTKSEQFAAAQQAAMAERRGLWGNCTPTSTDGGGYNSNPIGA